MDNVNPGSSVVWRTVYRGRVRWALPHIVVALTDTHIVLYIPPGTRGQRPHRALLDYTQQLATVSWEYREHIWHSAHLLRVTPRDGAHSIDLFWDPRDWSFRGWYVNLQEPLHESRFGFDTFDHALDLWIDPSGDWNWKDEDHLATLVDNGVFSAQEAAAIRAEGEDVLSRRSDLMPTGWEEWRPDEAWPLPSLPSDWAAL